MITAALWYASLGWYVFPVADDTKTPITPHGYLDATTNPEQIARWWTNTPNARIGLALRPSGLIAVDYDVGPGKEEGSYKSGDRTLAAVEAKYGALPRDWHQRSQRGGGHILMRDPSPGPDGWTRTQAIGGRCRGNLDFLELGFDVDVKCNGYILVEPSGSYKWLSGRVDAAGRPLVPAVPEAWTALLQKPPTALRASDVTVEGWKENAGAIEPDEETALRARLRELVRSNGAPSGRTFAAVKTIFHEYGRGLADGVRYLCEWNELPGAISHDDAELARQIERIAEQPNEGMRGRCLRSVQLAIDQSFNECKPTQSAVSTPPQLGTRVASIIDVIRAKANLPVILTPWQLFNGRTGGLELNSITIAIGYQGSGKSSQAAQLATYHAHTAPVVYYLGEMGARVFVARIVGQMLKRSWRSVLRGEVSDDEMHRVLDPLHLYIVAPQATPDDAIRAVVRQLQAIEAEGIRGVPLVVVDYVQLLGVGGRDVRQGMITAVRGIQMMTENADIVTWVLSQVSRGNSKRIREGVEDSIDLADTGAETAELERAATLQFALSYQQKDDTRVHEVTMNIGKRRFGGPTKLYFDFDGETGLFTQRETPIKPASENKRETDILFEIDSHWNGLCGGNPGSACSSRLNLTTLVNPKGLHRVSGSKDDVAKVLKQLVTTGMIELVDGSYRRKQR